MTILDAEMNLPSSFTYCSLADGRVEAEVRSVAALLDLQSAVVIRVSKMGVCRADVKEVIGARDIPADRGPLFGHEIVGTLVTNSVPGFDVAVGTRVTFNPNITPDRSGGFAEFMFVQGSADVLSQCVIPLRDQSSSEIMWIPEPFACIVHAVDSSPLSTINQGDRVAVIGAGCSGALFAMYCSFLGANVHIFNRGSERLEFLESRQLAHPSALHVLSDSVEHTDQFDHVIIATTRLVRSVMEHAHCLVRSEGTILVYGGTQSGDTWLDTNVDIDSIRRQENGKYAGVHDKRYLLTGAYGCSANDFNKSMQLVDEHPSEFPVESLTNKEVWLSEFPELINRMAAGADHPGKIIVSTSNTEAD